MTITIPTNSKANHKKLDKSEQLVIPIPKAKEAIPKREFKQEKQEMHDWLNSLSFE